MTEYFERTLALESPPEQVFAWHSKRSAFDRLAPPWLPISIVSQPDALVDGSRLIFKVNKGIPLRWVALHEEVEPGLGFVDVQERGPFASWRHEHLFEPTSDGCLLRDRIHYRLPMAKLGTLVAGAQVRADLEAMFAYRHHVTWHDLRLHHQLGGGAKRVAIMVGRSLASRRLGATLEAILDTGGHEILKPQPGRPRGELADTKLDAWIDLEPAGRESRLARCGANLLITALEPQPVWKRNTARRSVHLALAPLHPAPRPWFRRLSGVGAQQPWISVDDAASAIVACLQNEHLEGQIALSASRSKDSPGLEALYSAGFVSRHTDWYETCSRYEGRERRAWSDFLDDGQRMPAEN